MKLKNITFSYKKIIITIIVFILSGIVLYILWNCGTFLPGWAVWEENNITDTSGSYHISLKNKTAYVSLENREIWKSPKGVKVQQILSADIDYDGMDELILLCWKKGRFGKYKPFWIEKDEKKWSQHIFVYEYVNHEIQPKWMSSYIGQDVANISSSGGNQYAKYLLLTEPKGEISYWKWDSWGFKKEEAEISFAVFGDNLIHEPIYKYGLNHGGDFNFLYEHMIETIGENDIAVINQETPFVTDSSKYSDYPRFGTPIQVGDAIVNAGFHVVTCATNHALDQGTEGIHTTKNFFTKYGILCLGIQTTEEPENKPYEIIMRNNIKFALFNYTYDTNGIPLPKSYPYMVHLLEDEEQIRIDIEKAREEADFIIIFTHWGTENTEEIDDFQRKWASFFLENKVNVVIGTHPHILQPYEMLESTDGHKMLIYYSIGNYVSVQPEESCIKGGMAHFTVVPAPGGYEIKKYSLIPLTILWKKGGGYTPKLIFENPFHIPETNHKNKESGGKTLNANNEFCRRPITIPIVYSNLIHSLPFLPSAK